MEKTNRNDLADILKAIGIISVVIGHSCTTITPLNIQAKAFVYTYHLMVFFLVTGFCYKADKYAPHPVRFVWRRFLSIYVMDVVYTVIFILLHNTFVRLKMVTFGGTYNAARLIAAIKDALILNSTSEAFLSPLWFLPVMLVAVMAFGLLMSLSRFVFKKLGEKFSFLSGKEWIFDAVIVLLFACLGLYVHAKRMTFFWHAQTAILALPMFYVGFYLRKYWDKASRFFTWYGCIISAVILYVCASNRLIGGDLNSNMIYNKGLYWPLTLVGMYFCVSLARLIEKPQPLRRAFSLIGKNSFHIMALHFMFFKIVDIIAALVMGYGIETANGYPTSYNCWLLYWIAGVGGSLGLILLLKLLRDKIIKFIRKK